MSTKKSTNLGVIQGGTGAKVGYGQVQSGLRRGADTVACLTTDLESTDKVLFGIPIPTAAIISKVTTYNDDLDDASALTADIGLYAIDGFQKTVSGTKTNVLADDILDGDLFMDGRAFGQTADTAGTNRRFQDSNITTISKRVWELLGYDKDPGGLVGISITVDVVAGTPAAGDISVEVEYAI